MKTRLLCLALTALQPACAQEQAQHAAAAADLNHHRWTLDLEGGGQVALDFGERLYFEFEDGCRRVNGFARLQGATLVFEAMDAAGQPCDRNRSGLNPDSLLAAPWRVDVLEDGSLRLHQGESQFTLAPDDWR